MLMDFRSAATEHYLFRSLCVDSQLTYIYSPIQGEVRLTKREVRISGSISKSTLCIRICIM